MRKILTLLFATMAAVSVARADNASPSTEKKIPFHAIGNQTSLDADVMTNIPLGAAGYMGVLNAADGIQEGGIVRNAAYFNAEVTKRFAGRKVTAITTAIYWQGVKEAKVWIRKSLDGPDLWSITCRADEFGRLVDPNANEVIYDESGSATVIDYESPIKIPCDYTLDGTPVFVGHDLQLREEYGGIHAYVCSPAYTDGHWWFSPDINAGWEDFTGNGAYIMELSTIATEGSINGLQANDASITNMNSTRAKCGEKATATFIFGNYGQNRIKTVDFEYEIAGTKGTFSIDAGENLMPYGAVSPVSFDFTMPDEAKRHDLTVRIVKVNGKADTFIDGNEFTGAAIALNPDSEHQRVVVMENFGALYQSDEPYAIRSIENLQEAYGEQFILVDAHYGQTGVPDNWWNYDPWHCQDYAAEREAQFKIPYCRVNRVFAGDPFYGSEADFLAGRNGIRTVVDSFASEAAEALIDGNATLSADEASIDMVTNVTFLADVDRTDAYTIGYIVTEDGLTGKQRNIYAGNNECFAWFREMGLNKLPLWWERTFNDVAREGSLRFGVPGSLKGSATANQPITFKYATPSPRDYEDINNLNVVILLIEQSSGEIMAAKKVKVSTAAGIETINQQPIDNNRVYNLQGQLINPQLATKSAIIIKGGKKYINK